MKKQQEGGENSKGSHPPHYNGIAFCGPSGVGKTSIINAIIDTLKATPEIIMARCSVSCTTRELRKGEILHVDYHVLSELSFREMIIHGDFLEHQEVYPGIFYGTPEWELRDIQFLYKALPLLDIDINGAMQLKANPKIGELLIVGILPPSIEALEEMLRGRNDGMDEEKILSRLAKAPAEIELIKANADFCIENTPGFFRRSAGNIFGKILPFFQKFSTY